MKKNITAFVVFVFFVNCSLFSQTAVNTEGTTVFKKENPQKTKKEIETGDIIITTEKMKNPNKKEEVQSNNNEAIITDQKLRNTKSPK